MITAAATLSVATLSFAVDAPSEKTEKKPRDFALSVDVSGTSSLLERSDANYAATTSASLLPSYKLGKDFKIALTLGASQELTGERNATIDDGKVSLGHSPIALGPIFGISTAVTAVLPLSEESRLRTSLMTGVQTGLSLAADFSSLGIKSVAPNFDVIFGKNFHTYSVTTEGRMNSSYNLLFRPGISYSPLESLHFGVMVGRGFGWTYAGTRSDSFSVGGSIAFDVIANLNIYASLDTKGSLLKPNGQDINFTVLDGNTSEASLGLTYSF